MREPSREHVRTYGLTHVAIPVQDPGRSFAFYERLLGARMLYRDDAKIEFGTPGRPDVVALERGGPVPGSATHFGFRLVSPEDPAQLAATIERAGGTVVEAGTFEGGTPYVFARDPDGYLIELWYEPET